MVFKHFGSIKKYLHGFEVTNERNENDIALEYV